MAAAAWAVRRVRLSAWRGEAAVTDERGQYLLSVPEIAGAVAEAVTDVDSADDASKLRARRLSGGMSNFLFVLLEASDGSVVGLMRVYGAGADATVVRADEGAVFGALSDAGLGPALLSEWAGGRIEAFVAGTPVESRTLGRPESASLLREILAKVAAMHKLVIPSGLSSSSLAGVENSMLFHQLGSWLGQLEEAAQEGRKVNEQRRLLLTLPDMPVSIELRALRDHVEWLEAKWRAMDGVRMGLCHNDLHGGNIMATADDEVVLIDVEYAGYSMVGVDLGNMACEMMHSYECENHPGFVVRADEFPSPETRAAMVACYLDAAGESSNDAAVAALMAQVDLGILSSHLMWALWSFIQARTSDIAYGYTAYGLQRLDQFVHGRKASTAADAAAKAALASEADSE
ncbi:choline/ethanolamine kinase [Thecamonas trahens ATCC 50062]|uniref:Choline/ethanolamine kinase n=1 Tax=Thecamonas trahens ATCC 50062 TaxID=461836 RepID=A0A0L0D1F6_THETB|nr:choline/ethanolamine kinase [Thecamonas trahens ATCC 50062]KNC45970.1 choline/ethanolamine kinase [Thecamonas trahens ATCC 50062]|eukprot:XP_013762951.1 choline/ethanolamine kinase [Thecamonas trahens ATCC 50062]